MDAVGGADGDGTTMQKRMKENKQTRNKQINKQRRFRKILKRVQPGVLTGPRKKGVQPSVFPG